MNYAIPSSRFERKNQALPAEPAMNFYAPPKNPEYANSGVSNAGADSQGALPQYYRPAPAPERPGQTGETDAQIADRKRAASQASGFSAAGAGLSHGSVIATTDVGSQAVNVLGNTAAGALSGAAAGAVVGGIGAIPGAIIGGGVSLVTSGLNAWLGNKQARAARDRQNAILADARRIAAEETARDEKWKIQERLDNLDAAKESRRRYNQTQARQNMVDTATRLQAALANNASLRANWAKFGFN